MGKCVGLIVALLALSISLPAQAQQVDTTWTAPPSADSLKNPFVGDAAAVKDGQKIFDKMCVVCHGKKGKGDGVASVTLTPRPADFLALRVEHESDGAIFWKMTNGKPPMASYATLLTEEQRWKLVNYIRKLESKSK